MFPSAGKHSEFEAQEVIPRPVDGRSNAHVTYHCLCGYQRETHAEVKNDLRTSYLHIRRAYELR